jgi:hypothetical protein
MTTNAINKPEMMEYALIAGAILQGKVERNANPVLMRLTKIL